MYSNRFTMLTALSMTYPNSVGVLVVGVIVSPNAPATIVELRPLRRATSPAIASSAKALAFPISGSGGGGGGGGGVGILGVRKLMAVSYG